MKRGKHLLLLLTGIGIHLCNWAEAQTINYVQQDVILTSGATNDAQVNTLSIGGIESTRIYIDGLGRQTQSIAIKASPNSNNDIVQPMTYNVDGQKTTVYLPYTDNTGIYTSGSYRGTAINDQGTYYNNNGANKVANDVSPFSQKMFEDSPLRRLLEAGDVGDGFQPGQHNKSYNYRSNNATDNVLMWGADGTYMNQYYGVNSLAVTSVTKEDGESTITTFTDNLGHLILKRKVLSPTKNLDTYYVYNSSGSLMYVVPPKAVALMYQNNNFSLTQSGVNNLVFSYLYDNQGRTIQKNVPGSAPVYYIYDPLNRLVLVQDGNRRLVNQWYYIKYDVKNRPISQGIYTDLNPAHNGGAGGGMQQFVANNYATYAYESRTASGPSYYTNNCFPTTNSDSSPVADLAYSYYDDYYLTQGTTPNYQYQYQSLSGEPAMNAATAYTRGLPTIVRKRSVGAGLNNIWLISVIFYDKKGNPIQTQSNNHLGTPAGSNTVTDYKTNVVDFTSKPLVNFIKKAAGSAGSIAVKSTYTYDAHNVRLLYVDQVYNSQPSIRIASYEYNEMGQLIKKNLQPLSNLSSVPANVVLGPANSVTSGSITTITATNSITMSPGPVGSNTSFSIPTGATFSASVFSGALQSVDYRYNIRGQITSINNSTLTNDGGVTNSDSNDLFGMQIMYDKPDAALNTSVITTSPSFKGKMSAVKWMTVDNNLKKTNERSYVYTYDQAGRLLAANYAERAAGSNSATPFSVNENGFDEAGINYDENGNILNLNRNSSSIGGSSATQVDQLNYSYSLVNPNQLTTVSDNNNSTSTQYTGFGFRNLTGSTSSVYSYDANGNLKADPYKGITIDYDILNKTDNIKVVAGANGVTITGRYINYTYNADGIIIRKQQYDNINSVSQLITTTDYIDGFVYVNNSLSYFPMGEGRVMNVSGTLKPEYIIADQQGNARFSFQDNGAGQVKVIQENSYYAFGLALANSPINMPTVPNKRLYNDNSEWQNDYNNLPDYYQTLNRNYDAALGRFIAVDPMAETSLSRSTYHYAKNNPLSYNDPLGNDPGDTGGTGDDLQGGSETLYNYGGYDTQAESEGSSTAGTNAGGNSDLNNGPGYHYDYAINEQGDIIMTTIIQGDGVNTISFVYNTTPNSGANFYTNAPNGEAIIASNPDSADPQFSANPLTNLSFLSGGGGSGESAGETEPNTGITITNLVAIDHDINVKSSFFTVSHTYFNGKTSGTEGKYVTADVTTSNFGQEGAGQFLKLGKNFSIGFSVGKDGPSITFSTKSHNYSYGITDDGLSETEYEKGKDGQIPFGWSAKLSLHLEDGIKVILVQSFEFVEEEAEPVYEGAKELVAP